MYFEPQPDLAHERAIFEENGFLVVPDFLSPTELAELRDKIHAVMTGVLQPQPIDPANPLDDFMIQWEPSVKDIQTVSRKDKIRVIFHLCHSHPYFRALAVNPRLLDRVENLLQTPEIKLYTDQMFCKPARHGSEVPWHQDSAYWPAVEPRLLSCWIAIDDVTIENGCVRFVPGSHKAALPHHIIQTDNPNNLTTRPEHVDPSREIPVEMRAGSVCFHHALCLHRSLPNASDQQRRGLVVIYLPSDTKFHKPWNFRHGFQTIRSRQPT